MSKFSVVIVETSSRMIEVEANTKTEAEEIAERMWKNDEVELTAEDFDNVEFSAVEDEPTIEMPPHKKSKSRER